MKKIDLLFKSLFICMFVFAACSEDDENEPQLILSDYMATISEVSDVGDDCSSSDVQFNLSQPPAADDISEFRVYFYEVADGIPSEESLLTLANSSYSSFPSSGNGLKLKSGQLSISGFEIADDVEYQLIGVSIGMFAGSEVVAVSEPSANFSISTSFNEDDLKVRNLTIEDRHNTGAASDAVITFDLPVYNGNDITYQLVVASSEETVDINTIDGLSAESIQSIIIDNTSTPYETLISANLKDVDGLPIEQDKSYKAYIYTSASFKADAVSSLAESNEFTLKVNPETTSLAVGIEANDAIALDAAGNLYIAEYGVYNQSTYQGDGTAVLKVTPDGDVSTFVNSLKGPVGNTFDSNGNLLLSNNNNYVTGDIVSIDSDGVMSTVATIPGYPAGILAGPDSDYFVANYWTKDIFDPRGIISRIDKDGNVSVFANDTRLENGVGIDYDDNGNILIGNYETGDILSVNTAGDVSVIANIPRPNNQAAIGYIAYYNGYIYATGLTAAKLYKVSLSGDVSVYAGSGSIGTRNGEFDKATFTKLNGIAIDEQRKLIYVTDMQAGGKADVRVIPLID